MNKEQPIILVAYEANAQRCDTLVRDVKPHAEIYLCENFPHLHDVETRMIASRPNRDVISLFVRLTGTVDICINGVFISRDTFPADISTEHGAVKKAMNLLIKRS